MPMEDISFHPMSHKTFKDTARQLLRQWLAKIVDRDDSKRHETKAHMINKSKPKKISG